MKYGSESAESERALQNRSGLVLRCKRLIVAFRACFAQRRVDDAVVAIGEFFFFDFSEEIPTAVERLPQVSVFFDGRSFVKKALAFWGEGGFPDFPTLDFDHAVSLVFRFLADDEHAHPPLQKRFEIQRAFFVRIRPGHS